MITEHRQVAHRHGSSAVIDRRAQGIRKNGRLEAPGSIDPPRAHAIELSVTTTIARPETLRSQSRYGAPGGGPFKLIDSR